MYCIFLKVVLLGESTRKKKLSVSFFLGFWVKIHSPYHITDLCQYYVLPFLEDVDNSILAKIISNIYLSFIHELFLI